MQTNSSFTLVPAGRFPCLLDNLLQFADSARLMLFHLHLFHHVVYVSLGLLQVSSLCLLS